MSSKDTTISIGILNTWDSISLSVLTLYFLFCSRSWFPIFLVHTILCLVGLSFMLLVSADNPKWLLSKGRRTEAISAFNRIAVLNGSKNRIESDATFYECAEVDDGNTNKSALVELSRLISKDDDKP